MYINEKTKGTFDLHSDIRYEQWKEGNELPGVLTDEFLASIGYHAVTQVIPTHDWMTHGTSPNAPIKNEAGVWECSHNVIPLDPTIVLNNRNYVEVVRVDKINAKIREIDIRTIRYFREGDTVKLAALDAEIAALEAQLP
jgi:hypothetical protein